MQHPPVSGNPNILSLSDFGFAAAWQHRVPKGIGAAHRHQNCEIVYHLTGHGVTLLENGTRLKFEAGSTEVYAARLEHAQTNLSAGEDLCIQIRLSRRAAKMVPAYFYVPPAAGAPMRAEIASLCHSSWARSEADDPDRGPARPGAPAGQARWAAFDTDLFQAALKARAATLLLRLLAELEAERQIENAPPSRVYVQKALSYMQTHSQAADPISAVAGQVGIGYDRLRHIFQQQMGMSMKRHLMQLRIDKARNLLRHTLLPLKAIAGLCGFANERYFSTQFHKATGLPPGEFRRRQ